MVDSSTLAPEAYYEGLITRLLDKVHPRLRTTFYQLAVPFWFHQDLVAALTNTSFENAEGVLQRVAVYSMVSALPHDGQGEQAYAINASERDSLQRLAIQENPELYLAAHLTAFDYWQGEPDQNGFVQERMIMYHGLFVDAMAGMDLLTRAFTGYVEDGQLAFADQLLATAENAFPYLRLLGQDETFLRQLKGRIDLMHARSGMERQEWDEGLGIVNAIEPDLPPELTTYASALRGLAAAGDRREGPARYGQAIDHFRDALDKMALYPTGTLTEQALRAETYIALGDSYVALAQLARGYQERPATRKGVFAWVRLLYYFITNLPLIFYLSTVLGSRVWRPAFWPTLTNLDWVVARLFLAGGTAYRRVIKENGKLEPRFGLRAQEKLATLIHKLGDAAEAERLLTELLAQVDAAEAAGRPYSEYQEARLRLIRGQALSWQDRPEEAFAEAERAYPVFRTYEDVMRAAQTLELAGDAVLDIGDGDVIEAGQRYRSALELYVWEQDTIAASAVDAKLWRLPAGVLTGKPYPRIEERYYPVPYRHWLTRVFQQITVIILLSLAFILPILTIHLDNQQTLVPSINFEVTPLLAPEQDFTPTISQGVTNVLLEAMAEPSLLLWLTFVLLGAYLILSTGLGALILLQTNPDKIQLTSDKDLIRLSSDSVSEGIADESTTIRFTDAVRFIRSDVWVATTINGDSSDTIVESAQHAISISGQTAHYDVIQERLAAMIPAGIERIDASYNILRSKLGALLQLSLVWITLLALIAYFFPAALAFRLPLLGYSIADLQPLFFLTLFIPPVWWFIIQPLHLQRIRRHGNVLPYIVALGGVSLAWALLITQFRLQLTVPDIYPLSTSIIMCLAGAYTLWRFNVSREIFDWAGFLNLRLTRAAVGVLAIVVALLMAFFLLRELGVYHYKIQGNADRDRAVATNDDGSQGLTDEAMLTDGQKAELKEAVDHYTTAIDWASQSILGIQSPQLDPDLYVNRAIARMSIGTSVENPTDSLSATLDVDNNQFELALADFQSAIDLEPERGEYYLWRGFVQHSLGSENYAAARSDYEAALAFVSLTEEQRVKAYTGMGWIDFSVQDYESARSSFQNAVDIARGTPGEEHDGPDPNQPVDPGDSQGGRPTTGAVSDEALNDALLGLGYSYYELGDYQGARETWESAITESSAEPMILLSLGTLHWRLGTLYPSGSTGHVCDDERVSDRERATSAVNLGTAIDYFGQSIGIPSQADDALAFTYRTMAQVQFLLSSCPGQDSVAVLEEAIASYSAALAFDSDNALYYHMRGRLQYAAWSRTPAGTGASARTRLFDGLADQVTAISIRPEDDGGYQPNRWLGIIEAEAVAGSIQRGQALLDKGDFANALDYFILVANGAEDNSEAAFLAGLTLLYLGDQAAAEAWYAAGLERAAVADGGRAAVENALSALRPLAANSASGDDTTIGRILNSLEAALRG